jgi:hypothetical protein
MARHDQTSAYLPSSEMAAITAHPQAVALYISAEQFTTLGLGIEAPHQEFRQGKGRIHVSDIVAIVLDLLSNCDECLTIERYIFGLSPSECEAS